MNSMTPEEIIEKALERFEHPLLSYARRITGDEELARDAVQETFLRLSKQNVVELEPRLSPWLFCVCRNCALDFRRKVIPLPTSPSEREPECPCPDPASSAMRREDADIVRSLVSRLSERHREVVSLKFDAGMSYREMSEVTGLSVSNVGVQLHDAIKNLRRFWKELKLEDVSYG